MTNITVASANKVQQWSKDYQTEYTRESGFREFMGKDDNSPFRVVSDLTKNAGETVNIPYFAALSGAGVTGSTALYGAEEALPNYACQVRVSYFRNGVGIGADEAYKTNLDLANVARGSLKAWSGNKLRDDCKEALGHVIVKDSGVLPDTYVNYSDATAGQRNAYLVNNTDRMLFADTVGGTVMATQLATITGAKTLSSTMINKARSMARSTSTFSITPHRMDSKAGREWFVLFVGPEGYASALADASILAANKDARVRGVEDNPIFQAGDLIWNGVIIREIPELGNLGTVGAASAPVAPAYLCGANAVAVAYSKYATPVTQQFDYGRVNGVGIEEIRGINKFSVAGVQTGMVSLFHAI